MARLTDILVRHNIDFEVAAVQINKYFKDDYDQILLERLRYGSMYGDAGAILHQLPGLGIRKDKYSDLPHPILSDEERGPVIQLRKDIDTLAKELSKLVE